jgi:hypothetical protein
MLRLLTTIWVMIGTGAAIFQGFCVLQFLADDAGPSRSGVGHPDSSWIGVPGVTTAALESSLGGNAGATGFSALQQRIDLLSQFLEFRPLSSGKWLSLAGLRLLTPNRSEALSALRMSTISGPNESGVMWQRGIFGLLEWENLPSDARERTVADLSGAIITGGVGNNELNGAKFVTGTQPNVMRAQVKALLTARGVPTTALNTMGF